MRQLIRHFITALPLLAFGTLANAAVDYGYTYSPMFPSEATMEGLPYAIPCAKAKNQYGAEFYRCTWKILPRLIKTYDAAQQQNVTYNNQLSGLCRRGKCMVQGADGVFGLIEQDMSFTVSRHYYIYPSSDGLPIAYRMDGGPYQKGNAVSYTQARGLLSDFLLDHGQLESIVKDELAAYTLDSGATQLPATPKSNVVVKEASCNPQMDDDCQINNKKVAKEDLGQYLPTVKVDDVENAGGYCEYPICYGSNDKPIGIR
ncbi:hypothetical protein [Pseudomonas sp.]|uniref:hypothetical protein n=1 Tax=Pseudomonas sp. TaxID=306 RepID=UPI00248964AE|nr:hypothetical protein [Pseudomonas sp.]MDI1334240.1 hypothetical protein [Pseudomonas sp.]